MSKPISYTGASDAEKAIGLSGGLQEAAIPSVSMVKNEAYPISGAEAEVSKQQSANQQTKFPPASAQLED